MVKLLIKNRFAGLFGSMFSRGKKGSVRKASVGRIVLFSLLYLYVAVVFIGLATFMAISMGAMMLPAGASRLYYAIFTIAALSVLFILSIFETKSELFECRDNELLLSMPIRPRDLILSRIIVVLIYNYVTEAVVMLPAITVYAIFTRDVVGVIGGLIISLFIPLLATALASAVGYLIAEISRRVRSNNIVVIIVSLLFMGAYFYGCFALGFFSEDIAEGAMAFDFAALEKGAPLLSFIGSAALLSPLAAVTVIGISVFVAAVAYFVIAKNYLKIITDNRGKRRVEYKAKALRRSSAVSALTRKELARFFSSTTYMLNAGLGLVFEIIIGVFILFGRESVIMVGNELFGSTDFMAPMLISGVVFCSSMTMMSASSLSLEGSSLWVIKTIPVTEKQVLMSKMLPQVIVSAPPTLITSVLFIIASGSSFWLWPFFILVPQAANLFFALLGINMNVISHRFDYENEVQAVKSSLSVFLTMLLQMVTSMVVLVGALILSFLSPLLSAAAMLFFFSLASVGLLLMLLGPAARRYGRIEV